MNEVKVQWHSGFVAAVDLELSVNRSDLTYEREYNLKTKPLEIDLLVIKKDRAVQIENEIGRIFRGYNILEYKSPEDHLDIDTFYKSEAYAALYKSYGDTVDERRQMILQYLSLERRNRKVCFDILRIMGSVWRFLLRGSIISGEKSRFLPRLL